MSARPVHLAWLKANGHDLASLTGADLRALAAIDACWQLYPIANSPHQMAVAIRALLSQMQTKNWPLARELIARAMDWDDRERLWPEVAP